ncbi:CLUMA_CG020536, isoform A [Clunio marinus]|uniref:CLUMA_CG020536, isoform A n=1 Tax=Clunio marinus TaxID=568069 RepID=A0A1J1J585_9DIPT|nr:CLUMA_CG020536, isoform A [Clunio marinus]
MASVTRRDFYASHSHHIPTIAFRFQTTKEFEEFYGSQFSISLFIHEKLLIRDYHAMTLFLMLLTT